jgi:hypothetical protein
MEDSADRRIPAEVGIGCKFINKARAVLNTRKCRSCVNFVVYLPLE